MSDYVSSPPRHARPNDPSPRGGLANGSDNSSPGATGVSPVQSLLTWPAVQWANRLVLGPRARFAAAVVALAAVIVVLSLRTLHYLNVPGKPDAQRWALQDFRDAVYYPVTAVLDGANPYDTPNYMAQYPVNQLFPLYSPLTLLIHLPFGLLPYVWSEATYYVLTIGMTVLLAWMGLRFAGQRTEPAAVIGLAALVLISRPGHMNLLIGQVTMTVVVASIVALHFARSRPWLAGIALAVTTLKPTYGAPLVLLMLFRRDWRAAAIGIAVGAAGALTGIAVLALNNGGIVEVLTAIPVNYAEFQSHGGVDLSTSWARIDGFATLTRCLGYEPGTAVYLAVSLGVLGLAGAVVWRLARAVGDHDAEGISAAVICLAILTCCYHQAYDVLLLIVPAVAIAAAPAGSWSGVSTRLRWVVLGLLAVPLVNYAATRSIIDRLDLTGTAWTLVTALNGLALLAALLLCACAGWRYSATIRGDEDRRPRAT